MHRLLTCGRHFFLGHGSDSFTGSLAVFKQPSSQQLVFICVHSRISDGDLTDEEVKKQITYCTDHLGSSIWYLIIVTGAGSAARPMPNVLQVLVPSLVCCKRSNVISM